MIDVSNSNQQLSVETPSNGAKAVIKQLVDCSRLESVTMDTMQMLDNPQICLNPEAVERISLNWVTVLNETFHKLHIKKYGLHEAINQGVDGNAKSPDSEQLLQMQEHCSQFCSEKGAIILTPLRENEFCYVYDPLCLSSLMLKHVCELTQACFDVGYHGDILKFQKYEKAGIIESSPDSGGLTNEQNQGKNVGYSVEQSCILEKNQICDIQCTSSIPENISNYSKNVSKQTVEIEPAVSDLSSSGEYITHADDSHVSAQIDNHKSSLHITENPARSASNTNIPSVSIKESFEDSDTKMERLADGAAGNNQPSCYGKTEIDQSNVIASNMVPLEMQDQEDLMATGKDDSMAFFIRCYLPYLKLARVRQEILAGNLGYKSWCGLLAGMEGIVVCVSFNISLHN